jgi:catechol 2,3-dioxygenase-like lactoylglutathione lyase family enzyme
VLTRIDHVMIAVPNLEAGIEAYTRIGFNIYPGGAHADRATDNAVAFLEDDYLELLSLRDREARPANDSDARLAEFLARGGGFRYVAVQSDDLAADVAAMRGRGVDVSDPTHGARRTPAGQELRWKAASLGPRNVLPIFFVQHLTPLAERRRQVARAGDHPNGVLRVDRVYIATPDVAAAAETYARVLGLPVPKIQRGAVVKADMAVFDVGRPGSPWPSRPSPVPPRRRSRGAGPARSKRSIAPAAWTPRRASWPTTACRRRRAAFATRASRRCSCAPSMPAASTSAWWARRDRSAAGSV